MIKVGGYEPATRCTGAARPGAKALMAVCIARYSGMTNGGIYVCRTIAGSPNLSVHAEGRACDIMTGTGTPTMASKWLAEQLHVFSRELGVQGVIHNRRAWYCNTGTGWHPHLDSPHLNHNHAEMTRWAADNLDQADIRRVLVGPSVNGNLAGPILKQGSTGPAVLDMQRRLTAHGFNTGLDGIFGPRTHTAVRTFQTLAGIGVDGIIGPITRGRLR